MAADAINDAKAMLLTEISAALAANLKLGLDRVRPADGTGAVPPDQLLAMYKDVLEQNTELLSIYASRFQLEGNADLLAWCQGMIADTQRQLALVNKDQEPAITLKDLASGVISSLDEQGKLISLGGSEKVFGVVGKGLDRLDVIQKMLDGDFSAAAAVFAGSAVNTVVTGVLTGAVVAAGVVSWPIVAGIAVIGAVAGIVGGNMANDLVEDFFEFAKEPEDLRDDAYNSIVFQIQHGGSSYLPAMGDYLSFGTSGDDQLSAQYLQGNGSILIGGGGNDSLHGAERVDRLSGGAGNDLLKGYEGNDVLNGGAGNDVLEGGKGSDRLEGGTGFDTYEFHLADFAGGSQDIVVDTDGIGKITFDNVAIGDLSVNHVSRDGLGWETQDRKFRLQVVGSGDTSSLIITHRETGGRIVVRNWSNGELNITLPGLGQPGTPENPYALTNENDQVGHDGDPEEVRSGNDIISAMGGNDGVDGGYGDDWIDGGHGNDLILGGPGSNRLLGGLGDDVLLGIPMLLAWTVPNDLEGWYEDMRERNDVLNFGKGWYTHMEGHAPVNGDATQNLIGFQVSATYDNGQDPWVETDSNVSPSGDDEIDAGDGSDVAYGGEGDDNISGGTGNDLLIGGADNDYIRGEEDNDLILGDDFAAAGGMWDFVATQISSQANTSGNDTLIGGSGNDRIYGQGGHDIIDGGEGDDILQGDRVDYGLGYSYNVGGVAGDDFIDGGEGNDQIYGDGGNDTLRGGSGNDMIVGDSIGIDGSLHGNDTIDAGEGADTVIGLGGNDVIRGGDGNDILLGDGALSDVGADFHGNDTLYGEAGDDELQGNGGNDFLDGGTGDDLLSGQDGNDTLQGGDGKDELQGGDGQDTLSGGNDDDRLFGQDGDDVLSGDHGNDELYGGAGNDRLSGGAGIDKLGGGVGNDVLDGGDGNDTLDGEAGDDTIYGGAGNDTIDGDDGSDLVFGGAGDDGIYGGIGNDELHGEDGDDIISAAEGNDLVLGGAGNDMLNGDAGNDDVQGGDGNDHLTGGDGDDVLTGGAGNDLLRGGAGNDRFHFESGFGADLVVLEDAGAGQDTISFGSSIAAEDLTYTAHGLDLVILHASGVDSIVVRGFFAAGMAAAVQLPNGTVFDRAYFEQLLSIPVPTGVGSPGDDQMVGTENADNLHGGGGNDVIHGLAGDDFLYGGAGNDTLSGGLGGDVLDGGTGNDTYIFNFYDGYDSILNLGEADAGSDVIQLGTSITRDMINNFQVSGDDLMIAFRQGADFASIYLEGFLSAANGTHRIQFADGTWLSAQDFRGNSDAWVGTDGDDLYLGTAANNNVQGGLGNDELHGLAGDDRIFGGAGNDRIFGGAGNDSLDGDGGIDEIDGGDGDDQLYGDDAISGPGEYDVLRGGAGNDRYYVGAGYQDAPSPDTVIELAGEGIDTVYAESYSYTLTANVENLVGVYASTFLYWQNPEYYGWRVNIPRKFVGNDLDNTIQIGPAPWNGNHDQRLYLLDGGAGNDTLIGSIADEIYVVDSLGDVIVETDTGVGASFDTIRASLSYSLADHANIERLELWGANALSGWGNSGNNILVGRTSDVANHLYGGLGDDTYVITAKDVVVENAGEGIDTVIIDHVDEVSSATQWFNVSDYANVENLSLGNNLSLDLYFSGSNNEGAFNANLRGNAGDNRLVGNGFSNELRGGGGNDTLVGGERELNTSYATGRDYLYGEEGNDLLQAGSGGADLYGGTGNDTLEGGTGNDDFHYARGDGQDTIESKGYGVSTRDRVIFAAGIDPDDITWSQVGLDLVVQVGTDPSDRITVSGYWQESDAGIVLSQRIDEFVFADGTIRKGGLDRLPFTNNPPETLIYYFDHEAVGEEAFTLALPAGMFRDAADDTLSFSLGNGSPEWLAIDASTGVISGSPPNGGGEYTVQIVASDSWGQTTTSSLSLGVRNVIRGTTAADSLTGTQFRDDIHAGQGNDTLTGAGPGDRLYGGQGDDTYVVTDASQQIIELAGEGHDTVQSSSYTYTLGEQVEGLTLLGQAIEGIGNQLDNLIIGTDGDNLLDGGLGNDRLVGGLGDDIYRVDSASDQTVEQAGEGIDTVLADLSWQLGDNVENLELVGTGNWNATGNALDNQLIGNAGNNRMEGGGGNDWLQGAQGDDYYVTGSAQERVIEELDAGVDTVERRFETNLVLASNVEHLVLGAGIVTGNGNGLSNQITGNAAANRLSGMDGDDTLIGADGDDQLWGGNGLDILHGGNGADYLDGGAGADQLRGGAGNDVYIVDHADDTVIELAGEGTDQVQASASHVLSANVENLFLTGTAAIAGTGNDAANYIAGNAGANTLNGAGGNDTLSGGAGNDLLIGGSGNDAYLVDASSGSDTVDNTGGGSDTLFFGAGVSRERLSFSRNGNDLLISIDQSATPAVRVLNHFLGGDAAIDFVQPDGGNTLTAAQINQIVAGNGSGFDQVVQGTAAGEQLVGGAGKDLIEGLGGADTLFGMGGDDTLRGGDGNDQLAGGSGNGTGSGNDILEGGLGNDTLRGEDGTNTLSGGAGDDQYVYGGGTDVINNTGGGTDWLIFQNGIGTAQLAFTRDGNNLIITVNGNASQRVTVTDHFLGGDFALDYLQPASGSALNTAAINALVSNNGGGSNPGGGSPGMGNDADYPSVKTGTAGGEQIVGTSGRDLIKGLAGDDTLFGMGGDDKLDGGDGNDYLSGGNGSFGGSGKDILIGGAGDDQLVGEDGDDMLFGGTGNDTYFYTDASGADTIDNTGGGTDWLYLEGIDRARLAYHRDGDDLIVRVDGSASKQMRVLGHFLGGERAISFVQPGDGGYAISAATIAGQLTPLPAARAASSATASAAAPLDAPLPSLADEASAFVQAMDLFDDGHSISLPSTVTAAPVVAPPLAEASAQDVSPPTLRTSSSIRAGDTAASLAELQHLVDSMGSFGGKGAELALGSEDDPQASLAQGHALTGGRLNPRYTANAVRQLLL